MFLNGVVWVPPLQSERSRKQAREQEQRGAEKEKKRVTFDAEPKEKRVSFAATLSFPLCSPCPKVLSGSFASLPPPPRKW